MRRLAIFTFLLGCGGKTTPSAAPPTPAPTPSEAAACDAGDTAACTNFGWRLVHGDGVEKDEPRALALFEAGCAKDDALACGHLGVMLSQGMGGAPVDLARAQTLFTTSCDAGHHAGCHNLGVMFDDGIGVTADDVRATALFQRACDGGYQPGCLNLGTQLVAGEGVATNRARALELFTATCATGMGLGCRYAGMLSDEEGNRPAAEASWRKGCDAGDKESCGLLAPAVR